jgi:4-coumarate--CoA ligase
MQAAGRGGRRDPGVVRGAPENEADMMAYVAGRVASYKKLRMLRFVDAIPKSVSGKILRRQLRDDFIKRANTAAA